MSLTETRAFGVYIHWPFCLSKCPYCDFNSHVRHTAIDEARFTRAFAAEIAATAARVPARTVSTIFFGGGTPSLMQPATVGAILDAVARHWPIDPAVEVTLEANPTSVEATRFRGFRAAGVNRVSLGVQALDDGALKELGRLHSARARACRPTRFPTTRGPAPNAATTSSTGARRNMPASGRAPTAGSRSRAGATPLRPKSGRRAG